MVVMVLVVVVVVLTQPPVLSRRVPSSHGPCSPTVKHWPSLQWIMSLLGQPSSEPSRPSSRNTTFCGKPTAQVTSKARSKSIFAILRVGGWSVWLSLSVRTGQARDTGSRIKDWQGWKYWQLPTEGWKYWPTRAYPHGPLMVTCHKRNRFECRAVLRKLYSNDWNPR